METIDETFYSGSTSSKKIVFLYDDSGMVGMVYAVDGTANTYYFQRNLQGDVVAIYDTDSNLKVKYLYDA